MLDEAADANATVDEAGDKQKKNHIGGQRSDPC
jgi:hypothetical protein